MQRERSSRGGSDDTSPSWGNWSTSRAVAWTLVGSVLVLALAGFATGVLVMPGGADGGGVGDASGPTGGGVVGDVTTTAPTTDGSRSGGGAAGDGTDGGAATESPATTAEEPKTWTEYDGIVVFRNDDIQPYYRSETMRAVDQTFVDEGVPVTLGVIPQVNGEHSITESDVCTYLRERARENPDIFEFSLHGYTHEKRTDFHGGSEFGGLDPTTQREFVEDGTRTLTDCVGERPTTFVPPMDSYDEATVDALSAEGYTTVSGAGWFTADYYGTSEVFQQGGLVHVPNDGGFVANWTTGEFHDPATLEQRFDWAIEDEGLYVQMLHYQDFDTPERLEQLREFLQYVKGYGDVRFMTVGELGQHVADGTARQTDDGWEVYE
ncbi:DUF2334 domain-containing protein [Halomarina salina]|uniref:DUF2334 domain-containing protein n=1 Tax=Halomarina salina TaxID=1872699 RepID=A0ABD5RIC1_9EURY|nr:DUF2334 domain-containing protein [Halomarina salina]